MKKIYINGIGMSSPRGNDVKNFWENISTDESSFTGKIPDIKFNPKRNIRRADWFSISALNSAVKALEDSDVPKEEYENIGTIVNTSYGPVATILKFGSFIAEGKYDFVSPIDFANTVNNGCIGHMCTNLNLKGVSTMLICSNYIGYGMRLLRNEKSETVFCCGVDEYCQDLFQLLEKEHGPMSEGASGILLSTKKSEKTYCEILGFCEENINSSRAELQKEHIEDIMRKAINKSQILAENIDLIVGAFNDIQADYESEAIKALLGENKEIIRPKNVIGDTLGAALGFNLSIGALILKNQSIPKVFNKEDLEMKYILVNNCDISGIFTSYILKI